MSSLSGLLWAFCSELLNRPHHRMSNHRKIGRLNQLNKNQVPVKQKKSRFIYNW